MYDDVVKAAESLLKFRESAKAEALEIKRNIGKINLKDNAESPFLIKARPAENVSLKIAACDSGIYIKEMHTFQLILVRSAAAVFVYENSFLKESRILPEIPQVKTEIIYHEELDAVRFKNLLRLKIEMQTALEVLERESPDILIIDGSILPVPGDRPSDDSDLIEEYKKISALYSKLISRCSEKGAALVGIVKDSKSRKIAKMLCEKNVGVDTFFLDFLMEKGERTCAFFYSREENDLFKFIPQARDVMLFYLKAAENDRPLRIEFISNKYTFGELAEILYFLSAISSNFAYPAILFEIDSRVAITQNEIDGMEKALSLHSDFSISPLRRNSRPFR